LPEFDAEGCDARGGNVTIKKKLGPGVKFKASWARATGSAAASAPLRLFAHGSPGSAGVNLVGAF